MINTIVQRVTEIFKKANFETMSFNLFGEKKNKFCFDLLVKKAQTLYTVKIFPNIDNANEDVIREIKALCTLLNSKPILIGVKNRYEKLSLNTIYLRSDLPFITVETLENIINSNLFPHVLARRGGGVIFLDGTLMKNLREEKNISRKEMSEELGVTKRTICAYENESMRPSEKVAEKILNLLEDGSLFRKINVLEWNLKFTIDQGEIFEPDDLNDFETNLQGILDDIGLSSYWYRKGVVPFKLSLYSCIENEKKEFYPIFSGISEEDHKINAQQLNALSLFTNILAKKALLIVDNIIRIPDGLLQNKIPIIKIKSLEKMESEDEFIGFIQESND